MWLPLCVLLLNMLTPQQPLRAPRPVHDPCSRARTAASAYRYCQTEVAMMASRRLAVIYN
eukprot:COSAG01_NODE_3450_length_6083_cov_3.770555_4_plen_60_part_00